VGHRWRCDRRSATGDQHAGAQKCFENVELDLFMPVKTERRIPGSVKEAEKDEQRSTTEKPPPFPAPFARQLGLAGGGARLEVSPHSESLVSKTNDQQSARRIR